MADLKRNLRHGGPIRGPGTGTSDDIKATVPEGSYIMPADSTLQAGIDRLRKMKQAYDAHKAVPSGFGAAAGFKPQGVPVNLSNGEHALSPEQVYAVGETVLNAVKDATHTPAAAQGGMTGQFFADGGKVDTKAAAIRAFKERMTPRSSSSREPFGDGVKTDTASAIRAFQERMKPRTPPAGSVAAEGVKVSSASDIARKFRERMTPRSNPAPEQPKGLGLKGIKEFVDRMEAAKKEEPRFNFRELAKQEREKRDKQAAPRNFDAMSVLRARFGLSENKPRQSFQHGGSVWEDPERRQPSSNAAQPIQSVSGAPGVQRQGNSYSAAPSTPAPAAPPKTNSAEVLDNRRFGQDGVRPAPAATPASASPMSNPSVQSEQGRILSGVGQAMGNASPAPRSGAGPSPMNGAVARGNAARVERTGGQGMYAQANGGFGQMAERAFPNTATAIRGAGQNIAESYEKGGLPAAVGATVRNTMVPAIGLADDVFTGVKQIGAPVAHAVKTAATGDPTPIGGATPAARATPQQPAAAATASSAQGFDPNGYTPQQRGTVADLQRKAWQAQARGGLRNGNQEAMDLYNAEQMTRGSGITAQRGANGVMEFSGNGANADPSMAQYQGYSQGFDLNAANAEMARANAERESYLNAQAGANGGPRGGVIGDSSAAQRERAAIMSAALTPYRGAQGRQLTANQLRTASGLMESEQRDSTSRYGIDAGSEQARMREQSAAMERGDLAPGRMMAAQGQQLQNARYAQESGLIDQILNAEGPEDQGRLIAQLRALRGQEAPRPDNSLEKARYSAIADLYKTYSANPPVGADGKTPVPFEQWAQPVLSMFGGGQQAQQGGANIWSDPRAAAIKGNPNMTREQKLAALNDLDYL